MFFRALPIFVLFSAAFAAEPSQAQAVRLEQTSSVEIKASSGDRITMAPGMTNILRIPRAVRTVLIGNPGVLDTTLIDDKTLALTAKAAGTTNLMLLDEKNVDILQATVQVGPHAHQIQAFYGDQVQTYSCAPGCIGDPRPVQTPQFVTTYETRDARGNVVNVTRSGPDVPAPLSQAPPTPSPAPAAPSR